ncbi:MAG: M48 family metallopeptidase [Deltaproteobacteria bacterium]|nr:M48 family metallopeptidase [Deltaproteobacteria bacterium]MBZ0220621.1 M48 family metallopeptidase [Deltaproteobacteria bacterium]
MTRTVLFIAAVLLAFSGCARVPYTERTQIMIVSERQEERIGETLFSQIKAEADLSENARYNSLIGEVGGRIASAAEKPDYEWEFVVIENPAVNAFALPGGKVALNTGILPVCRDEAGVAAVMGHEVAHVIARHGAERMSQEQALQIGGAALSAALLGTSPVAREGLLQAYGLGAKVGVLLPYSRKHELEADRIGLILMAKAGYNPESAVEFWERMTAREGAAPPEFLSTHPTDRKRVDELRSFLPEAMEHYREAIRKDPSLERPPRPLN